MELIRGLVNLKPRHRGCVASIGNFDGVHRGHQAVLCQLREKAQEFGLPSAVVVFEPMPLEFFATTVPPARLMRLAEKCQVLAACGIDRVLCLHFNRALADLSPDSFIDRILLEGLGVRYLVVGDDFRFGKQRRGDIALLKQVGATRGFEVADTDTLEEHGERIGSRRIRELLAAGDLASASRLLGRPFSFSGRVLHGERLGRKLGFPTANIALHRRVPPVQGIFAARVHGVDGTPREATAYVGRRTAVGGAQILLEAFLLDFSADLYGRRLQIELLRRLREDRHFDTLEALTAQIQQDIQATRNWFADNKHRA